MSLTVLVTGATGLLGREVLKAFKRGGWITIGQGYTRANPPTILKANLEDSKDIENLLNKTSPRVVIHCAANKSPDDCAKSPEQARRINVEATRYLAESASSRSILLIYISTDYVFPGIEGEAPYEASAPTGPTNDYGQLKRDGELAVLAATKDTGLGIVLRVPVLYGPAEKDSESAVNVLLDAVDKAQYPEAGVKMDDWAQRYPTNTEDVGRVCNEIAVYYLKEKTKLASLPKILQFSSEDRMTKYEMCEKFAAIKGVKIPGMIPNKEGNDPNSLAKRPFNTKLSTKELQELGIDIKTKDFEKWWKQQLAT